MWKPVDDDDNGDFLDTVVAAMVGDVAAGADFISVTPMRNQSGEGTKGDAE